MRLKYLFVAAMPLAVAACEPRTLVMGARTIIGINAQVNAEQTSGSLVVGYDRNFAAIVPRSADLPPPKEGDPKPASDARDAMAAMVCSDLKVKGISIRSYTESIATGDAAVRFAQQLRNNTATTRDFFSCMRAVPSGDGS
jgi:hypothetical protein